MINNSSNLGEYREAINNLENNYLPKSGGTMTGSITIAKTNEAFKRTDDKGFIQVCGGTTQSDGGSVLLFGENFYYDTYGGGFELRTGILDDGSWKAFRGKQDGTLTWNGNNIITSAGGTMTGSLGFQSQAYIKGLISQDEHGNPLYQQTVGFENNGGFVLLRRADSTAWNQSSLAALGSSDGNGNVRYLMLFPDGRLVLNDKEVRYITDTYSSGTSWYRIWSDGWIEQGGYNSAGGIITYLKAFSNTNYTLVGGLIPGTPSTTYEHLNMASQTTTGFSYTRYDNYNLKWYACGY